MTKRIIYIFFLITSFAISASAQDSTKASPFSIWGYVDAYYSYFSDSVGVGNFQKFTTISPRSNSFGLNVAMVNAKYATDKVHAVIGLHYGDIPLSSWSKTYNFIQEAYAGTRLCKKAWIDLGFFRTHIGAEGLLPKENITSSVSIATFNEPYYEAGVRVNYKPTAKLVFDFYGLNGYNLYEDNNEKKSFGLLATYSFTDSLSIGYSNYIGNDAPVGDSLSRLRTYQNVFLNFQKNKIKIVIGGNVATQMNSDTTKTKAAALYTSALATVRYQAAAKFALYARGEFFNDPSGFLGGSFVDKTNKTTGIKLWGATAGIEYKPAENSYIRFEARQLQCDKNQEIFHWKNKNHNNRLEIMFNMGFYF